MPIISFPEKNITKEISSEISLAEAIRQAGLYLETPCNGIGTCGKCKVWVRGELSLPKAPELKYINPQNSERLACMAIVKGDLEVKFLNKKEELKTIKVNYSKEVEADSAVKLVKLPDLRKDSPIPYANYLGYKNNYLDLYKKISSIELDSPGELWGIVFEDRLLDISSNKKEVLGLAIDIGTTGISYYLINLADGTMLTKFASLNPQTQYGGDVLTRITYCMKEADGPIRMQKILVDEINQTVAKMLSPNFDCQDIYQICVSANTTMIHLLLGINPANLAKGPYRPILLNPDNLKARDIGLEVNAAALLNIMPAASSYVGGDIVSGVMAANFLGKEEAVFLDIGTNGEMAVLKEGKIVATSTAAGPALEGMNIECGCRAQEGALESFSISEDLEISFSTIGNKKPMGICGSGLLDITASLVKSNVLLSSGRWNADMPAKLATRLVGKKLYITEDIYISQKDIRQIQLAKGAIATGLIMMLAELAIDIKEIKKIYIAGAFGYHVNPENIKAIGLIPKGYKGEIEFLGNTSLQGACLALQNKKYLSQAQLLKETMEILELSLRDNFQDIFVSQLSF